MTTELPPEGGSEMDVMSRLGNALVPPEVPEEQPESQAETTEELPPEAEQPEEAAPAEPQEELVEVTTASGKTYSVPQELANEVMHKADYTRKTQEVSSLTKAVQAAQRQQALYAQFQQQTSEDQQSLAQAKAELARFKNLDWTGLDTDTILKTRIHIDGLRDRITELEGGLNQKAQRIQHEFANLRKDAARNAYEYIGKHVRDWTPDSSTEREVASYASQFGLEGEVLGELAVLYPGIAVMAHKASQFDKLQANKGQAVQKAQQAPPVVKPGGVRNTGAVQQQNYAKARQDLKKNPNSLDAAARVFMQRMK